MYWRVLLYAVMLIKLQCSIFCFFAAHIILRLFLVTISMAGCVGGEWNR
jgi:hypothetical protein